MDGDVDVGALRDAFFRIRRDIDLLREEVSYVRQGLLELYDQTDLSSFVRSSVGQTDEQTQKVPLEGLKSGEKNFSIGNEGVQTDRQTYKQTDRQGNFPSSGVSNAFEQASEALASLDQVREEIKVKFKYLTDQEMLVFSALYTFQEQKNAQATQITYKVLADYLSLSESSIRDYVAKLIKKGIPVHKKKVNNKLIVLEIDQKVMDLVSLDALLKLRDL